MVQPLGLPRLTAMLKRARVHFRIEPIPSAAGIAAAQDDKLIAELTAEPAMSELDVTDAARENASTSVSERTQRLAARLVASGAAERALALLLERVSTETQCSPREITPLTVNAGQGQRGHFAAPRAGHRNGRAMPARDNGRPAPWRDGGHAVPHARDEQPSDGWVRFRVSWGQAQGADVRRLLPMLCRRGNVRGTDIGSIHLTPSFSFVDVASRVAADFERAARRPDPRDPAVTVRRA
jgi:ATP-dependent RNA helicase DeaD